MNIRKNCSALVVSIFVLAVSSLATTLKRMDLDELASGASVIARVRCVANETRVDRGEIWTFTTFEVRETLKGNASRLVTVRLIGGRVGHLISHVDGVPRFFPGEENYLFLEMTAAGDFSVAGWVQGTFRVHAVPQTGKESVTQDTGAVTIFDPATRQFKAGGVKNMPLEVFRQHVRDAVERQRMGKLP